MKRSSAPPVRSLDLRSYVPALISVLENKLTNTASAVYRRHFGIGATEMRIIVQLGQQSRMSGSELGLAAALDKAAVSRAVTSLRRLGLIRVVADRGRRQSITLTGKGSEIYHQGVAISQAREQRLLAGLSVAEREAVIRFLDRMLENVPLLMAAAEAAQPAEPGRDLAPAAPV